MHTTMTAQDLERAAQQWLTVAMGKDACVGVWFMGSLYRVRWWDEGWHETTVPAVQFQAKVRALLDPDRLETVGDEWGREVILDVQHQDLDAAISYAAYCASDYDRVIVRRGGEVLHVARAR